ncbi:RNP-1 like RNA-binding protein [Oleidesulfovibrio alaskensis G20]|jgi:RNA recognition motif-containing protein|uniref:RNP-1 like RNA-binding protein n=1 Tax=Oleidesulfovibrio alaskensis (strain ATCC BAA-1058 / DSM 17464 / G20) TaxID=207559 RepID=Q313C0_OLEA2|nr:RNA-binding protein [Oleidesulfovibrio alaskensis]ABB37976.1 RNP-1 like RNA-binding protein [Oleidesulfovibrio alaskensis G20]MBG0772879.1 RNA-binding protein [Oleidesulfovibrio alaskensis]
MNIYVGNLSYQMSEDDLRGAFEEFGAVDKVRIITDHDTGRSKGFGFVEMAEDSEANAAIEALNGREMGGRSITVNEARPRPERSGGGGGGFRRSGGGGGYGNRGGQGGGYGRRY